MDKIKVNLFKSEGKDLSYTSRFLLSLDRFYGIKYDCQSIQHNYIIVTYKQHYSWSLCDNGGEVNIGKINFSETDRGIPSSSFKKPSGLTAETMAYRIAMAIQGELIDWDFFDMPSLEESYGHLAKEPKFVEALELSIVSPDSKVHPGTQAVPRIGPQLCETQPETGLG